MTVNHLIESLQRLSPEERELTVMYPEGDGGVIDREWWIISGADLYEGGFIGTALVYRSSLWKSWLDMQQRLYIIATLL